MIYYCLVPSLHTFSITGTDKHGHLLIMFIYRDINFDSLESKFTTEEVGQMIGQKLEAWSWLKHHMSEKSKVKRQKHVSHPVLQAMRHSDES